MFLVGVIIEYVVWGVV